ncbi:integrase core domain-containing protein [Phaeobacter sp. B1627]|uniref:integrase core domain-containing protein n=1 Tax=Phaeobacter sp. B1627 TaxID=2583809 RepID=UPI00111BA640|nr:transposase [Phaeobacter sp. B1627]
MITCCAISGAVQATIASKSMSFRRCFGPGCISGTVMEWAESRDIPMSHIQPREPQQSACVERYNRMNRHEWLDLHIFESIAEVRHFSTECLWSSNKERLSLGNGGRTSAQKLKMAT